MVVAVVLIGLVLVPSAVAVSSGATVWVSRYDGPADAAGNSGDRPTSVIVSPDGSRLFVTGYSPSASQFEDYATVAYDAVSGAKLWVRRYGAANGDDRASSMAVSPDSSEVFVTGVSPYAPSDGAFATVAYDAATGRTLWVRRYKAPVAGGYLSDSIAASADGSKVFISGGSPGTASVDDYDYTTIAYRAATGRTIWVRRYDGPAGGFDVSYAIATSSKGGKVFVTGNSAQTADSGGSFAGTTVAYNAATGKEIWTRRYRAATAYSVIVARSKVFVTGNGTSGYETVAYAASTGHRLWVGRYSPPGGGIHYVASAAVSSDGRRVFVTGVDFGAGSGDYLTVAFDGRSGAKLWARRYNDSLNGQDWASSIAVSPDGSQVFVTGYSLAVSGETSDYDYVTVSYDARTGTKRWLRRYNRANGLDEPASVIASSDGSRVFVTGSSAPLADDPDFPDWDYVTIAYVA